MFKLSLAKGANTPVKVKSERSIIQVDIQGDSEVLVRIFIRIK